MGLVLLHYAQCLSVIRLLRPYPTQPSSHWL
jgi:hypothetical protein